MSMTIDEAGTVVTLLQTFWPIEWSQRMSRRHEDALKGELARMFSAFELEDVLEAIRSLAETVQRPPALSTILETAMNAAGMTQEAAGWHWDQYVARWITVNIDGYPYEYVDSFNVKVFDDGRVYGPPGRKVDRAECVRQGIIPGALLEHRPVPQPKRTVSEQLGFSLIPEDEDPFRGGGQA